jgi:hypothetical protein
VPVAGGQTEGAIVALVHGSGAFELLVHSHVRIAWSNRYSPTGPRRAGSAGVTG